MCLIREDKEKIRMIKNYEFKGLRDYKAIIAQSEKKNFFDQYSIMRAFSRNIAPHNARQLCGAATPGGTGCRVAYIGGEWYHTVNDFLGASRHWQDHAGHDNQQYVAAPVLHPQCHQQWGEGSARSDRESQGGGERYPFYRRDTPFFEKPAGFAARGGGERDSDPDRRHNRESVVRGDIGFAVALSGVCAERVWRGRDATAH